MRFALVGALSLAGLLTGCNSALDSESGADAGLPSAPDQQRQAPARSHARAGSDSLTMVSDVAGHGAQVDEATCVALDVDLEVAGDHTPVPSPSQDFPLVVARNDRRLIAGLRTGIAGMAVDGHRTMLIPPALGYGEAGWGNGLVGPDDTLHADVSVLWAGRRPAWTWSQLHRAASTGGEALDLETGSGTPFASGTTGVVMIEAVNLDAEVAMASMWDRCDARAVDPDAGDLSGWFINDLAGLRPGGTRLVVQPGGATGDRDADAWVVTLAWTQP